MVDERLTKHLRSYLGDWPPTTRLTVVGSAQRTKPGWDEVIRPVLGIETLQGTILSVPPKYLDRVHELSIQCGGDLDETGAGLAELLGKTGWRFGRGFYRWTTKPKVVEAANPSSRGMWVRPDDARTPPWLRQFSGDVLIAMEDGELAASVGIKRHDHWGHELAVVTEEPFRNQGIAARLIARAATRVLDQGAVPIYVHADDNVGSAKAAQAAGFDDKGWRICGLFPPSRL